MTVARGPFGRMTSRVDTVAALVLGAIHRGVPVASAYEPLLQRALRWPRTLFQRIISS
jgi:hypothetical protein